MSSNVASSNGAAYVSRGTKRPRDDCGQPGADTNAQHAKAPIQNQDDGSGTSAVDQKRARLEAWKRKMAQKGIREKLLKQRQKIEELQSSSQVHSQQQQQQQQQQQTSNTPPPSLSAPKIEIKFGVKGAPAPMPSVVSGARSIFDTGQRSEKPVSDTQTLDAMEASDDEEDPLDAYMKQIEKEVADVLPRKPVVESVTLDEFMRDVAKGGGAFNDTAGPQDGGKDDDDDDDDFHRKFVEALRNQGSVGTPASSSSPSNGSHSQQGAKFSESATEDGTSRKSSASGRRKGTLLLDNDLEDDLAAEAQIASRQSELGKLSATNKKDLKQVDHSKIDYEPFRKDFFIIPRELASLSRQEVQELRLELDGIKVRGRGCPPPVRDWYQCGLNDTTLDVIRENNFEKPFPIQAQAIPVIMSGRDMIGIAKTGSGKTLAFVLPMLRHVLDQRTVYEGEGPVGLVIAPTRELAAQIFSDLQVFAKPLGLRCVCAYGGAPIKDQIRQLKGGSHIVVCTPGRMIDLLCANRGRVVNLRRVTYVVLDEADRMFDMGFGPQVTRIVNNVRPDRQIVLFSATFPKPLEALAKRVLKNPIEIVVGGRSVSADTVEQHVKVVNEESKFLCLLELLGRWNERGLILVFVDKQSEVGELYNDLTAAGYTQLLTLHGGMDQIDRDDMLRSFKRKEKNILIATSVASRGLDVKDLQLVINYNVPDHYEDYVHRVGRTGRAGNKGTAYTFITPEEERYAPILVQALKLSKQAVPEDLQRLADGFVEKRKRGLVEHGPSRMSGYKTQGYKFDESEQNKKREDIKMQMKAMGMEDEIEEDDEMDAAAGDEEPPEETKSMFLSGIRKVSGSAAAVSPSPVPSGALSDKLLKARMVAAAITAGVEKQQQPAAGPSAVSGGDAAVTTVEGEGEEEEENVRYENEIEINDYPQIARWRVTNKDALFEIMDSTGANVTVRGIYVEAGKPVPPGERKLHLLVESNSRHTVERATLVIESILNAATISATNYATKHAGRQPGKYKIEFG